MVTVCVCSKLKTSWKSVVFTTDHLISNAHWWNNCSIYNQSWLRLISNIPLYPKWILPIYMSITLVAASIHTLVVFTLETDYPFKTRQNWQVNTDRLFVQNKNRYVFTLRQIIRLTRIIQRITRLKRMIPSLVWEPPLALIKTNAL